MNRVSTPRWRGPAKILYVDDAGTTVKFQFLTAEVARHCVRKKVGRQGADEVGWNPMSSISGRMELAPWGNINSGANEDEVDVD